MWFFLIKLRSKVQFCQFFKILKMSLNSRTGMKFAIFWKKVTQMSQNPANVVCERPPMTFVHYVLVFRLQSQVYWLNHRKAVFKECANWVWCLYLSYSGQLGILSQIAIIQIGHGGLYRDLHGQVYWLEHRKAVYQECANQVCYRRTVKHTGIK